MEKRSLHPDIKVNKAQKAEVCAAVKIRFQADFDSIVPDDSFDPLAHGKSLKKLVETFLAGSVSNTENKKFIKNAFDEKINKFKSGGNIYSAMNLEMFSRNILK